MECYSMNEVKVINSLLVAILMLSLLMLSWTAVYLSGVAGQGMQRTTIAAFCI